MKLLLPNSNPSKDPSAPFVKSFPVRESTSNSSMDETLRKLLDSSVAKASQPYFNAATGAWMAGILKSILTHGYVYDEEIGHLSVNTIRNKIYQSIGYLRKHNLEWASVMGRIEVKQTEKGWRISARDGQQIRSPLLFSEFQEFLQGGTGVFERKGIVLTHTEIDKLQSMLPKNVISHVAYNMIYIKFV